MTDILIRDVPESIVDIIDRNARRLGIALSEYLPRALARERVSGDADTTTADFERVSERFAGLADDESMRQAWL